MAEVAYWLQAVLPYQMVQMLGTDVPLQSSLLDYDDDLITYQSLVYGKGALFLARLRELMGDEMFFALLQQHYDAHKYGLLDADAFLRSLEKILRDSDLDELSRAEILELYDAVVVRGESIEGMAELDVLGGLDGLLEGQLSAEDLGGMLGLAEQIGGLLDGEISPEELEELILRLEELLRGIEP